MLPRPLAEVGLFAFAIDVRGVRGIADHHRRPIGSIHKDALMADRVPRRRDHPHAVSDQRVSVQQLESGICKVEPL